MNELPHLDSIDKFQLELARLHLIRKTTKQKIKRTYRLTKTDKAEILSKTNGRCHLCGRQLSVDNFECDHVEKHTVGGSSDPTNFLAACRTCNNYRWHYLPEEYQWIIKIGVWARTQIERDTPIGHKIADSFVKRDSKRETRRKTPRTLTK